MFTLGIFVLSLLGGAIGAMTGQGGGLILVPFLSLVMHVDVKTAVAASVISVIATSSGAAAAYVRDRISNIKVGMYLEMFTIVGALTGAAITIRAGGRWIYLLFGLVLLASLVALWVKPPVGETFNMRQDRLSRYLELEGEYYDHAAGKVLQYKATRAWLGGPAMFGAGLIAGMLGIGAGSLKVLIHDLIMEMPPKVSTSTSNFIIGVTALAAASAYLAAGWIRADVAVPIILGITLGSRTGARYMVRLSNDFVRKFFMVVLAFLGVQMILRGVGVL